MLFDVDAVLREWDARVSAEHVSLDLQYSSMLTMGILMVMTIAMYKQEGLNIITELF
jgi:hypothetical protein